MPGVSTYSAVQICEATSSAAFETVTKRNVDKFSPCGDCAIRHFCGSPCPGEAQEMNGGMGKTGAFREFYKKTG